MGFGNYSSEAHEAITQARTHLSREQVFTQRACHPLMNPHGVRARESRDSAAHPASFGVVFALDVTGSMGKIPEQLALRSLPKFMKTLEGVGIADAQVLFMAVGDAYTDQAPLQVGQFESGAREMDQWLTWSFLEGNGGGNDHESYELALYFAARHLEMDCVAKRKKRGYLIMTGNELPYPRVARDQVKRLIGDDLPADMPVEQVIAVLSQTFEPFFLIPTLDDRRNCERVWRDLLGDRVICMSDPADTCNVAASLIALSERVVPDVTALAKKLVSAGVSREHVAATIQAITPFAATLEADGVPAPHLDGAKVPAAGGPSGLARK